MLRKNVIISYWICFDSKHPSQLYYGFEKKKKKTTLRTKLIRYVLSGVFFLQAFLFEVFKILGVESKLIFSHCDLVLEPKKT